MKTITTIIFCAVLGFASNCYAAPRFVNKKVVVLDIVHITNAHMGDKTFKKLVKEAIQHMRSSGYRIKLGKFYLRNDSLSDLRLSPENTLDVFEQEYVYSHYRYINLRKQGHILYVAAPPWTIGSTLNSDGWPEGGKLYSGGFAIQSSARRGGYAYGTALLHGNGGVERYEQTFRILEHEIIHVSGGHHINDGMNVMDENAQAQVSSVRSPILPETIEQIGMYLRGWK